MGAALSSIGYMYQVRYGLLLLLKSKSDSEFHIERFDDLAITEPGGLNKTVQLKHKEKPLTNSSHDLWKTIGNWMSLADKKLITNNTILTIITTSKSPEGSAAMKLSPDEKIRNEEEALQILNQVSKNPKKTKIEPIQKRFFYLDEDIKRNLFSKVFIIDSSSNIIDVKDDIMQELGRTTVKKHREIFFERIEGWWFDKIIKKLLHMDEFPITNSELEAKIDDLREQFFAENLPIDYECLVIDRESEDSAKDKIFVKQLELISLSEPRIKKAISDYYKAYSQRSRWTREKLVFFDEIEIYEKRLRDEWERQFYKMKEYVGEQATATRKTLEGKKLFDWMDSTADFCIRKNCLTPYVMRGSYHMMSDRLEVGWHPDFVKKLQHLLQVP